MPSKRPCPTDATEISLSGWSSAAGRTGTSRSKATSSRTRLRTPDEEELAELELPSLGKHLGSGNDTSLEGVERPSTPPPSVARTALLGTPPSLLSPNRSGSPPSLLDYTKRSPLSVREDPDARKLYLILPPSSPNSSPSRNRSSRKRKDGPEVGTLSPSPSPSSLSRTDMEAGAGASLRRRIVLKGRGAGTENVGLGVGLEDKGDESEADEDGLVLQPGRDKGKRVRLGSPKAASEEQHDANTWAATAEEEDEGLVITPRIVREQ